MAILAGPSCGSSDETALNCCVINYICSYCSCGSSQRSLASSNNEAACKQYVDSNTLGCCPTSYGACYNETGALASCANAK
jgi:hypothetical protein